MKFSDEIEKTREYLSEIREELWQFTVHGTHPNVRSQFDTHLEKFEAFAKEADKTATNPMNRYQDSAVQKYLASQSVVQICPKRARVSDIFNETL